MAGGVQSVQRSLRLLEALAARADAPLAALARDTGLTPSTTHRLLATLVADGYATQDAGSARYRLGPRALALAGAAEARIAPLRAAARPHMLALRERHDESTNLAVLDGLEIVYVDQVQSESRAIRMFTRAGTRAPAAATGAGKAMLAFEPPERLAALYAAAPYAAHAPGTIVTAAALRAELARVRADGYALDHEEYEEGVICAAAPIRGRRGGLDGVAVGALSVSGPAARMERLDLAALGADVATQAAAAAAALAAAG